jgi:hypothetical protein|tara:strand:- start:82 stop:438 length:357 start_codon:yes stop_codon:yes gene_type:complete
MKEIIVRGYNLSKQVLHGMTAEQYLDLIEFQDFKCYLSGIEFVYSEEKMKFMDINGKAPPIDHDHETGFIRGILSEKVNWLERQWDMGSYGKLPKPKELTEYQNNPPAFQVFGKITYK